jgi:hypothetical protein
MANSRPRTPTERAPIETTILSPEGLNDSGSLKIREIRYISTDACPHCE